MKLDLESMADVAFGVAVITICLCGAALAVAATILFFCAQ